MSLVRWNDRYATGIAKIDQQHQELFRAVNDLHAAFKGGAAKTQIGKSIAFLAGYTAEHFRDEEGIMQSYGFPGLSGHQAEHSLLMEQVRDFQDKYQRTPDAVRPMEVARFLGDWLTHHIDQEDMKYAGFLKERGVK